MAVGDDVPVKRIDECRTDGDEYGVGLSQEFSRLGAGVVQLGDAFFFCLCRKGTVGVPAVPKSVAALVLENILFAEDFCFDNILDVAFNGKRVVDGAEGVRHHLEFPFRKLRRNVVCKARPEKRDAARVIDANARFRNLDSSRKLHRTNLIKIIKCVTGSFSSDGKEFYIVKTANFLIFSTIL